MRKRGCQRGQRHNSVPVFRDRFIQCLPCPHAVLDSLWHSLPRTFPGSACQRGRQVAQHLLRCEVIQRSDFASCQVLPSSLTGF